MTEKSLSFSKLQKVFKTGLHQYEPVATEQNTTADNEIKIDENTLWIPMCQVKSKNPDLLLRWELDAIQDVIEQINLKAVISKPTFIIKGECEECAVLCFQEHLELLDFMPLEEVLYQDKDEDEDEDLTE